MIFNHMRVVVEEDLLAGEEVLADQEEMADLLAFKKLSLEFQVKTIQFMQQCPTRTSPVRKG